MSRPPVRLRVHLLSGVPGGTSLSTQWDTHVLLRQAPRVRQNGPMHQEPQVRYAMQQIRHVLQQRPQAADTVEGIHTFWIEWQEPQPPLAATQAALELLQDEGVVEWVRLESGRQVWRRAR